MRGSTLSRSTAPTQKPPCRSRRRRTCQASRRSRAHQRAARLAAALGDPGHHGGGGLHVQLAGGVVVEEHQGLGALGQQVVDAHGHQVDAHRVVNAGLDGHLQLGAHPVGGGDQQGIVVAGGLEVEERAETAQ